MYLPTVRGDTRIPSLTNSSLAIRSSPHNGFSAAILRIRLRNSSGIGSHPCPALPAPEDPPPHSMPANDGRRSHVDHRIAPIEESGEQRKADASHVIHASWFDTTLDISRELSAKDQILSADRAGGTQERDAQPQDVRDDSDDCSRQLQHALIMPDSASVCVCRTPKCPRRELLRATVVQPRCAVNSWVVNHSRTPSMRPRLGVDRCKTPARSCREDPCIARPLSYETRSTMLESVACASER
jgi:hypothetical protein